MDRVYAYVSRRAGSRTVAEDVTSAVFEQALTHLPRFEWRGVPFRATLASPRTRLPITGSAGGARRQRRRRTCRMNASTQELERRVSLFQLMDRLPETQRQVIQMRFIEERVSRGFWRRSIDRKGGQAAAAARSRESAEKRRERPAGRSGEQERHG